MANNCFSTPYKPESSTGLYLAQVLSHAEKHPEKLACVFQPRGPETAETLSYGELNKQVVTRAKLLVESGLSGQHVGLLFPTGIEFVVDFLACLAAGAYAVPMNLTKNAKQLERTLTILRDTGVKTILTTQETQVLLHAELRDIQALSGFRWLDERHAATQNRTLPSIQLDDTAFIQYTSGSTSAPKGVIVTHRNIIDNQLAIQKACDHQPGLIAGGWLPQFHDMGLIGHMLQPLFLGGTYVFMPPLNFIQRPLRWLQLIDQYRIHSSAAPNFGYEHCMKMIRDDKQIQQLDLSCWKVALNGSEPVKASTM
ncbi:AMP-binding protein, partial [Photobacterium sanctipauli]